MLNKNYNKNLRTFANQNRKQMTKAEACIWKYALKSSMRNGYKFRRQRPIAKYIVDFACLELNLIIEIDGGTQNIESINNKDSIRQTELESLGFKVIRFTDDEVLKNMDGVIFKIDETIERILSSAGGGG
jgi:very-short-patch-repair endonuclease